MAFATAERLDRGPVIEVVRLAGKVRVELGGYVLAESEAVLELRERGHQPVLYFPRESVRMDRLVRSETRTHCPRKGDASYFTVAVGSCWVEDLAWSYEDPIPAAAPIRERIAFAGPEIDAWDERGNRVMGSQRLAVDCGCE